MKISQLFNIHYGSKDYHSKKWLENKNGNIPLISSKASDRGVYGYFDIEPNYCHILTIPSTGSIGYALYHKYPCCVDDNTLVLEPLIDMSERQLIFYSLVLRQYANRFMYGRQITPKRLGELEIISLEEIPAWIEKIEIPNFNDIAESKNSATVKLPPLNLWKDFKYNDIFEMSRGRGGSATDAKKNPGTNYYIGASNENNGITQYTSLDTTEPANCITVANNGSVGAAFYQPQPFLASSDVTILTIKDKELTPAIAMFLITLIRQESNKINYGRKWGITRMKESIISLPVLSDNTPDWNLIEQYINSLPYSKYL